MVVPSPGLAVISVLATTDDGSSTTCDLNSPNDLAVRLTAELLQAAFQYAINLFRLSPSA
jgi:hypothetical protein